MPFKVRIIKDGYGRKAGQVVTVTEFDGGHLMAFGFAVPYVEERREVQTVAPPETRVVLPKIETIVTPPVVDLKVDAPKVEKPKGIFGRRGRQKK